MDCFLGKFSEHEAFHSVKLYKALEQNVSNFATIVGHNTIRFAIHETECELQCSYNATVLRTMGRNGFYVVFVATIPAWKFVENQGICIATLETLVTILKDRATQSGSIVCMADNTEWKAVNYWN